METPHATIIFADMRGFTQWSNDIEVFQHLEPFLLQFYTMIGDHFSDTFIKKLGDGVMIVEEMTQEPVSEDEIKSLAQSVLQKIKDIDNTFAQACHDFATRYGCHTNLRLGWGITRGVVIKLDPRDYLGANVNTCSRLMSVARPWGIVMEREDFAVLPPSPPYELLPEERTFAGLAKDIPVWVTPEIATGFVPREQRRETPEVHVNGICMRKANGTIELLISQRASDRRLYSGLYEGGTGGQLAHGESFVEGVKRHFKSEMGIDVEVLKNFSMHYEIREPNAPLIPGIRFLCRYQDGEPDSPRHSDIRWVTEDALRAMSEEKFIPGVKTEMLELTERYRTSKDSK